MNPRKTLSQAPIDHGHSRPSPPQMVLPTKLVSSLGTTKQVHGSSLDHRPQLTEYEDVLDSYYSASHVKDWPPPYQRFPLRVANTQFSCTAPLEVPSILPLRSPLSASNLQQYTISSESLPLPSPVDIDDQPKTANPGGQSSSTTSTAKQKITAALEDTQVFLGGLIKHPTESNRHYTILRHSPGLLCYSGPTTSLAVSIFSDRPVLPKRRIWLQLRGWSGNTGMAMKTLFRSNDDWVNVTPTQQLNVLDVPQVDERSWQRDIKKLTSKATKTQSKHVLRETVVVRIPFEAQDGYFRLVLTSAESKSILCPSPVFRIASTSLNASVLKGASLSTLPLELAVGAAQTVAATAATKIVAPWAGIVTSRAGKVQEKLIKKTPVVKYGGHAKQAWDISGLQGRIDTAKERHKVQRDEALQRLSVGRVATAPAALSSNIVGDDEGPAEPFPIQLKGPVVKGTGSSTEVLAMPTANLDDVPTEIVSMLPEGVYFGWAFVKPNDRSQTPLHEQWRQAIISVTFASLDGGSKIAQRKVIRSYLIYDYPPDTSFVGSKLKVLVMGYLRPLTPATEREVVLLETINDIAIVQASLKRSAWGLEQVLERARTAQNRKGITDRLVDVRAAGQPHIDRVLVHLLGVRTDSAGAYDRGAYGNGGFWIKRD